MRARGSVLRQAGLLARTARRPERTGFTQGWAPYAVPR